VSGAENCPLKVGDTYEIDVPMRWADADALNHLNNAVYFRYMEEGRISMFYTGNVPQSNQFGPVVVHCSCDFKKSIVYPATVRVSHRLVRIGRSSMEHEVDLSVVTGDQLELRAQGRSVMVWMDFAADKSHPWPAEVLEALSRVVNR
jgi:acyl-CoA thioester hydrolase